MISAQQARAGRALLNWSQKDLSRESGISLNAINNFEREIVTPRRDTLDSLRRTLEQAGLEFIGETGVNRIQERLDVEVVATEGIAKTLTDDICAALRGGVGNLYMNGVDLGAFPPGEVGEFLRIESSARSETLQRCVLLPYGDFNFLSREPVYRWASREGVGEVAFITYGQTLVLLMWEPTPRAIIIRNRAVAETFRKQFEIRWAGARPPSPEQHVRGWEEWHGRTWDDGAASTAAAESIAAE